MTNLSRITSLALLDKVSINANTLAGLLDLSSRRVYQLVDEGVLNKEGASFDFVKSIKNYISYLKSLSSVSDDIEEQLKIEQTRLTKAKADKAEIETKMLDESLISVSEMNEKVAAMILNTRGRVLTIAERAAIRLTGEQDKALIKEILEDEVYQTLTALSKSDIFEATFDGNNE